MWDPHVSSFFLLILSSPREHKGRPQAVVAAAAGSSGKRRRAAAEPPEPRTPEELADHIHARRARRPPCSRVVEMVQGGQPAAEAHGRDLSSPPPASPPDDGCCLLPGSCDGRRLLWPRVTSGGGGGDPSIAQSSVGRAPEERAPVSALCAGGRELLGAVARAPGRGWRAAARAPGRSAAAAGSSGGARLPELLRPWRRVTGARQSTGTRLLFSKINRDPIAFLQNLQGPFCFFLGTDMWAPHVITVN
jgi:hypothetical protein